MWNELNPPAPEKIFASMNANPRPQTGWLGKIR
jgi:hypothetical protein